MTKWLSENRTLLLRLFGTVAAIVLIVLLIRQEGWTEIVDSLRQISPASFFLPGLGKAGTGPENQNPISSQPEESFQVVANAK